MAIQPVGYLKLYRELFDKPIWVCSNSKQKVILITLLCMANFKEKEWEFEGKKYKCKAGEFITSLESIAKECGEDVSIQNVRTFLKNLETYEFLTNKSTNKSRLISITNWSLYQSNDSELTSKLTGNQQATNKQLTTKEEGKERKESKEVIIDEFFETIWKLYPKKDGKASVKHTQRERLYKLGYDKVKLCIDRHLNSTEPKYYRAGNNFFNTYYIDYLDENYKPKQQDQPKRRGICIWLIMKCKLLVIF